MNPGLGLKCTRFSRRRGAIVMLLVGGIGVAALTTTLDFAERSMAEYKISQGEMSGFKASLLAKAGFQGALAALRKIPEEQLYQSGIGLNPPPVPMGGGWIYYKIQGEDGKININSIFNADTKELNLRNQEMAGRLLERLGMKKDLFNPVVDWLDDDSQGNFEISYYEKLTPPRKIKNGYMYSLSELTSVKGFDPKIVYGSQKPPDYEQKYSKDFMSDEEKSLIGESDFVLANNLTAFVPFQRNYDDRINLNAAPYFVLMSLSDFMNRQSVLQIMKMKIKKGGYLKEIKDLETIPEFQVPSVGGLSLYKELAGEGTDVSGGRIKTKGEIFRITAVGEVERNYNSKKSSDVMKGPKIVRRITGIFDLTNNLMLYYRED
ncbi:general secretion pathway protein GspK [Leptospira licerasiae]|uniref:Type II secretion system protein K-like protein n=1 Tax=Leptospira licerasiae str. MMD4847 TaxID=1049971 RepID=A0ABN0H9W7_9LEPT|nr:type II secretion system protein GspK [Leptospira licerasiae]EIE01663.1 type II secretion system protein K-like protein [Leptospira licerasiae serovar Varillal str. VAR 010]EJZ42375.1 type II secretion system protein K-like protein [Leptospira licerasiae str. MMD4847]